MQEYKDIDIDSLISDGPDTINKNFKTLMSNNAGGEFPTDNLYAGMICYRSDEGKIYTLKNDLSTWVELFDVSSASGAVAPLADALTNTLSIANGGTGATTVEDARKNLGIEDVVTYDVLPISQGGTGATTAENARTNLGVNDFVTDLSVSGKTITYNKKDGTSGTITTQDTDTTYSAGAGISLNGTTFSNSGVRSVATGGSNGTISVNTNGTSSNVAVKGLGSAAYTASSAYAAANHNHSADNITSGTLPVSRGGTGLTAAPSMLTNLGSTSAASPLQASPRPGVTGTLPIANGGTGAATASAALSNLGITYGTTDLTAGSSSLTTGAIYIVYE